MLSENAVELGEAVEAAGGGYLCNGDLGIDQHGLYIPDPGHLDVIRDGKARDILKLVGQVTAADAELLGQLFQGKLLGVMAVDIACDGVDFPLHGGHFRFVGILVAFLIQVQQGQKLHKLLVNDQIPHGVGFGGQKVNIIELAVKLFPQLPVKAEHRNFPVEDLGQLLILIGEARHGFGHAELNNQPPAGFSHGILGLVQHIGPDADDVEGLQLEGLSLHKVDGMGAQHHAQLIEGVKMLKLHVDLRAAHVIVKVVKQRVVLAVHADGIPVFIQGQILDQHRSSSGFSRKSRQPSVWKGALILACMSGSARKLQPQKRTSAVWKAFT